jgi:hypothetical protein
MKTTPKKDDALERDEATRALLAWIDDGGRWAAVGGEHGAGCTSVVHDAIVQRQLEAVWLATGAVAGVHLESAASSTVAVNGKRKIIVIDEFDAIVAADPQTTASIATAIKKGVVPIILIARGDPAGWRTKVGDMVPKAATRVHVVPPTDRPIAIATKGLDGATAALMGIDDSAIIAAFRGDGIASGAVFDNYPKYTKSFEDAHAIADAFSAHNAIQDTMARVGVHDDPYAAMPIATAALRCSARKITIGTFGTVWSKNNATYAKKSTIRSITRERLERGGLCHLAAHEGLDAVHHMLRHAVSRGTWAEAAAIARGAGLTSTGTLAVMRLWPSGYTLATHAKVRKHL